MCPIMLYNIKILCYITCVLLCYITCVMLLYNMGDGMLRYITFCHVML